MAAKKRVAKKESPLAREAVVPTPITKLTIDYGREDINDIARKVNEIIDHLNG